MFNRRTRAIRSLVQIAALSLLLIPLFLIPAHAASCCGGVSISDAFVVPNLKKAAVGLVATTRYESGYVDGTGGRQPSSLRRTGLNMNVGTGYRFHPRVQATVALPVALQRHQLKMLDSTGGGIGDISTQLRVTALSEDTCFLVPIQELSWQQVKPTIDFFVRNLWPSGRATHNSTDALAASVTGRGMFGVSAGVEVTKVWGVLGNAIGLEFGGLLPETSNPIQENWFTTTLSSGMQYYWDYQKYVGLAWVHTSERNLVNSARTVSGALSALVGVMVNNEMNLRASIGVQNWLYARDMPASVSGVISWVYLFD